MLYSSCAHNEWQKEKKSKEIMDDTCNARIGDMFVPRVLSMDIVNHGL